MSDGLQVTMRLLGAEKVITAMGGTGREVVTPNMMESIGMLAVRSVQRGVREQKSPDGTPYPSVDRWGEGGAQRMIDSARLLNSITFVVTGQTVTVGTNVKYAAAQNFGGTWGAKTAKLLAIPLTRRIARAYVAGKSLRLQYPEAFIFKSLTQGLFLVRKYPGAKRGSKKQLEFLYQLVASVTLKGTHFLDRLSDEGEADILRYLETTLARTFTESTGGQA